MKKIKLLCTAIAALATLTACGNDNNAYGEYCEQALDAFPTLINFSTGKEVFPKEEGKIKALDYTMYLGLKDLRWQDLDFELTWTAAPADKWVVSEYTTADGSIRNKFRPLFDAEEFDCSLSVVINCLNDKGKSQGHAERKWEFHTEIHKAPDLTEYQHVTCEQLAKGQVTDGSKVYTYAYTTTSHEPSDTHLYTGVYMQDGEFGSLMYAGKLSSIWFSGGFEIGDRVMCAGTVSPYNGLVEIKPDFIEFTKDSDPLAAAVARPVVTEFTAENPFNEANGKNYQSSLVRLKGLVYKEGKVDATSTTAQIKFMQGETEVTVSCNYHLGVTMMTALKNHIDSFEAGVTQVEFYGPASYYNAVQVIPTFGVESLKVVTE